jgi:hypothetical protein
MWEYFDPVTLGRLVRVIPGWGPEPNPCWRTRTREVDLHQGKLDLCYGPRQQGPAPLVAIRQLHTLIQALGSDGYQYLVRKRALPSGKHHLTPFYFELLTVPIPIDHFFQSVGD